MEKLLGLPIASSEHARDIDFAMGLVHWLVLALFVGWSVYFIFVLFRFRQGRNPKADYHGAKTNASSYVEGGVALVEAVLLIGFSMPLWADRVSHFPSEGEALQVRVVAEQFAWNMHYPGADGIFGRTDPKLVDTQTNPLGLDFSDPHAKDDIVSMNQLHLPVNKPVIIRLSSKDVIHSFGVPEMRVKQDAVPGLEIPLWFTPTMTTEELRQLTGRPITYEIACAQLCGIGHYRMRGFVTVHEQAGYEAWLESQSPAGEQEDSFWQ